MIRQSQSYTHIVRFLQSGIRTVFLFITLIFMTSCPSELVPDIPPSMGRAILDTGDDILASTDEPIWFVRARGSNLPWGAVSSTEGATYSIPVEIIARSGTEGASIRYAIGNNTNQVLPTATAPLINESSPLEVADSGEQKTFTAFAFAPLLGDSDYSTITITLDRFRTGTPRFNIAPGSYTSSQTLELLPEREGDVLHYEFALTDTNGDNRIDLEDVATPDISSPQYSSGISILSSGIFCIKVIASSDPGWDNSSIASACYARSFSYFSIADFNTLDAAGNDSPTTLWSDGSTMWVVDSIDDKIYAYNLNTRERDPAKDFDTLTVAGNNAPVGIWSDGTTMWVSDFDNHIIYAYNMETKERDPSGDFNTLNAAGNNAPLGIWSDGTTMWVGDINNNVIYAYNMETKERDPSGDFNTLAAARINDFIGIWSDGTTMWVIDYADVIIYAFNMETKERDPSKDFNTLAAAMNHFPAGIWSDGSTVWVTDLGDSKVYAYNM